jgi:hypothetical protein
MKRSWEEMGGLTLIRHLLVQVPFDGREDAIAYAPQEILYTVHLFHLPRVKYGKEGAEYSSFDGARCLGEITMQILIELKPVERAQ